MPQKSLISEVILTPLVFQMCQKCLIFEHI